MTATLSGVAATGVEPPLAGLGVDHQEGRSLQVTWQGGELVRYVYGPWDPQIESPRPYFHPVRTLGGDLVSLYRPHDHVWHKGIAWSLSNVGQDNFWGGATYLRPDGYQQLPNNGAMVHERFDAIDLSDGMVRVEEQLAWHTEAGQHVIQEWRRLSVAVLPEHSAWRLVFHSSMRNVSGATIPIGSPTTEGRENAGYSGLLWRGPRSFRDGHVVMADTGGGPEGQGGGSIREGADELMGRRGPWLAYIGRHDEHSRTSTLVFRDNPGNPGYPNQWFVRTDPFACVCPAPFFSEVYQLHDDEVLSLRYDVVVADGELDAATCGKLGSEVQP